MLNCPAALARQPTQPAHCQAAQDPPHKSKACQRAACLPQSGGSIGKSKPAHWAFPDCFYRSCRRVDLILLRADKAYNFGLVKDSLTPPRSQGQAFGFGIFFYRLFFF